MNKWIKSDGKIVKEEAGVVHIQGAAGGTVAITSDDVRERNGRLEILEGTTAFIVEKPADNDVPTSIQMTEGEMNARRCRKTACIALLLICCDNGKVVGGCIGLGGC